MLFCVASLAPLTLVATASGSSATKVLAKTDFLTYLGKNRQSLLVAAAQQEGHLNWWTSLAGPIVSSLTTAFNSEYPYIKVTVTRPASTAALETQLSEAARTNSVTADVLEDDPNPLQILQSLNLLSPFTLPGISKIPAKWKITGHGGLVWQVSDRMSVLGFGYNTTLIPAADVPKNLEGLLNPALKGKLVLPVASGEAWVGAVLHLMGQKKGEAFLKELGATQDVQVTDVSAGTTDAEIGGGQIAASPASYRDHDLTEASSGNPIKWLPLGISYTQAGSVSIVKNGPDPAAAILFASFLFGAAAHSVYASQWYSFPSEKLDYPIWLPESTFNTAYKYEQADNLWIQLFNQDFGA